MGKAGQGQIATIPATGGQPTQLTKSLYNGLQEWSPDGRRLAFATFNANQFEIATIGADGSNLHTLTSNDVWDIFPVWSPDGSMIAFATQVKGHFDIALMDSSGANLRVLTNTPGDEGAPQWTPDGKSLVFSSVNDNRKLVTVGVERLLTEH
jgi:TolB protein